MRGGRLLTLLDPGLFLDRRRRLPRASGTRGMQSNEWLVTRQPVNSRIRQSTFVDIWFVYGDTFCLR